MSANNTLAAKHFSVNYSSLTTVLVGKSETKFQLHEDIICHSSDFFRRACSGEFKEATEKVIRLPEMDVKSFASYAHWIYTGTIKLQIDEPSEKKPNASNVQLALIKLYIAADILSDMALRNAAIDRYIATGKTIIVPGPTRVNMAYEKTPDGSKLRQLMVDYYVNYTDVEAFKEKGERFPKAFLFDVLCSNMATAKLGPSALSPIATARSLKTCRYHEHDDQLLECGKV